MHVGLCDSGTSLPKNSTGCHLLKAMCYLTQFVVSTITTETHAEHLAKLFMENVVIKFGMVATLVVDSGSRFKILFNDMCAALGTIY